MQALNLAIVDVFLEHQEAQMVSGYIQEERTPESTLFVGALSQMWVFALYEWLRTWRQRAKDVVRWAKEIRAIPSERRDARRAAKAAEIAARAAEPEGAALFHGRAYEAAATDDGFVASIQNALDRSERLFRRTEALRMSLAKHELPHVPGSHAMAPGYGRIDMLTGSIQWMVVLRGNQIDLISRRALADECRRLASDRAPAILPEALQEKVKKLPEHSYGGKRVVALLDDGVKYAGVYVGWNKEILMVEGHDDGVPFDVARVIDVQPDPLPPDDGEPTRCRDR